MPSVAIIGASNKRDKFSNKAVRAYLKHGWKVYPVHPKEASVEEQQAYPSLASVSGPMDRVVLYVPPQAGMVVLDEMASHRQAELFISPGADSPELLEKAGKLRLKFTQNCAIVALGEDPNQL